MQIKTETLIQVLKDMGINVLLALIAILFLKIEVDIVASFFNGLLFVNILKTYIIRRLCHINRINIFSETNVHVLSDIFIVLIATLIAKTMYDIPFNYSVLLFVIGQSINWVTTYIVRQFFEKRNAR